MSDKADLYLDESIRCFDKADEFMQARADLLQTARTLEELTTGVSYAVAMEIQWNLEQAKMCLRYAKKLKKEGDKMMKRSLRHG